MPEPSGLRIAFFGLGTMGEPMAAHLLRAGHAVTVFNRTHSKAVDFLAKYGGCIALSPAQTVKSANVVVSCVGQDDDVRQLMCGEQGALPHLSSGAVWVDHTTTSASLAREMHGQAALYGVSFIDAPVSGGSIGALQGSLSIMCGGEQAVVDRVSPMLSAYAKTVIRIGDIGAGQLTKMVNQIAVVGVLQGLAEAFAFGKKAGLDMPKVLDAISQGAAGSWQMTHRGTTMVNGEFDFGFAVDWMRKDLTICLEQAKQQGSSMPLTQIVDQFYAELQSMGGGRWDTSSLICRLIDQAPPG